MYHFFKNVCIIAIAIIASAHSAFASAKTDKEAQEVIDAYIDTTGGVEAREAINSMVEVSEWIYVKDGSSIKHQTTIYRKRPNCHATSTEIPEVGTSRYGFYKGEAWTKDPVDGLQLTPPELLPQKEKDAIMFPELVLDTLYKEIRFKGMNKRGLQELLLIDKQGFEETWLFDPTTHFLNEIHRYLEIPGQGSYRMVIAKSEYIEVAGIKFPHKTDWITPSYGIGIHTTEMEVNTAIEDHIFMNPGK